MSWYLYSNPADTVSTFFQIKKDPTTEEEKEIFKALLWSDPSNRFVKGDE